MEPGHAGQHAALVQDHQAPRRDPAHARLGASVRHAARAAATPARPRSAARRLRLSHVRPHRRGARPTVHGWTRTPVRSASRSRHSARVRWFASAQQRPATPRPPRRDPRPRAAALLGRPPPSRARRRRPRWAVERPTANRRAAAPAAAAAVSTRPRRSAEYDPAVDASEPPCGHRCPDFLAPRYSDRVIPPAERKARELRGSSGRFLLKRPSEYFSGQMVSFTRWAGRVAEVGLSGPGGPVPGTRRRSASGLEAGAVRPPAKGGRPSQRVAAEPGVHADRPKGRRNGHLPAGPTRAVVRRKVAAAELARTRRENGRLGQEDEILERAAALLAEEAIASQGTAPPPPGTPASRSGRRAGAAVGGFHARSHRRPGPRREDGRRPGAGIAAVVAASRRTHGSPRVRAERRPGGRLRVRGGLRRPPAPAFRPRLPDPGPGSRADGRGRVTGLAPPSTPAGEAQVGFGSCRRNGPVAGTGGEAGSGRLLQPRNPRPDRRRAGRSLGRVLARPPGKAWPDARDREEEPWQHSAPSTSSTRAGSGCWCGSTSTSRCRTAR